MTNPFADVAKAKLAEAEALDNATKKVANLAVTPAVALELVNEIRTGMGVQPIDALPPGRQGDPQACVLANALSVDEAQAVVGGSITLTGLTTDAQYSLVARGIAKEIDETTVRIEADVVGKFIGAFDSGELPRYIEEDE